MAHLLGLIISCCVLTLCRARVIDCNATQDGNQTKYTISDMPPGSDDDCQYWWANASNIVLAHGWKKDMHGNPELVETNRINMLITSKCLSVILYTRSCLSEEDSYATCNVNCSSNDPFQEDTVPENSPIWIAAAVIIPVVIVVVIVVVILVYLYMYTRDKNKMTRIYSCKKLSGIYSIVTTQEPDPQAADGVSRIV